MPRLLPALLALGSLPAGGCVVHTYQPMSGLHRPVVIDPNLANFGGVRLRLVCVPGGTLDRAGAALLCRHLTTLFENQGATVEAVVAGSDALAGAEDPAQAGPPDLVVELRARRIHEAGHPLSYAAMIASWSLVPALTEFTFEQELTVRDGTGFLLATDTLRGRIAHWFGFGSWAGNKLLDLTVRPKEEEVIGDHAERDLSADLYRQVSQTVFDARVQAEVLKRAAEARP